ncbi:ribosomal protection-like ABC-F family protein [Bacillus horti]|uniref:Ribosome protection protein VmlR n=1 Tax=Caldalkalibacillus horti TaxID=77523 RepID=A0ABT9W204_9BACI|nr:ABC-F type ribosomal protection protein [Bacillus horti]MDQ0167279.1 macrolide transport system ATP-binding/permease protein [Bacillus horti]
MQELLRIENMHYEIEGISILENIQTTIQRGDIIGIIGKNGAGKSTLLKLLNEELSPTSGKIKKVQPQLKMTTVEQETTSYSFEEMTSQEVTLLEKWNVPTHDFSSLSGGEKLKARLAIGIAQGSDLLLLDEPTNHLDEQSTEFLIQLLKNYKGTVILVSHDRYFLDEVVTKIWSIENKKVVTYKGNYSNYMEFRQQKRKAQQHDYEQQQKRISQVEGQISELKSWSKKGHAQSTKQEGIKEYHRKKAKRLDSQVKSKQKRLEKELESLEAKALEPEYTVQFTMQTNNKVGRRFLEVKNLTKSFGSTLLFKEAHFTIQHGEKVALVGPNGSGKTTLLKIILGGESATGEVWVSPSANIGYLKQDVFDLPLEQTPEEFFYTENFRQRGHVQNAMKHLGFTSAQWTEQMKYMSMGERVKCKLMKFILEEKDVLILDEPTNHLDLPSREQLEETLAHYKGTLLVVSHDRYFVEKTTDTKLLLFNQIIRKQLNQEASKIGFMKYNKEKNRGKSKALNNDHNKNNIDANIADKGERRLQLETQRQEVLGKLSFMSPGSPEYKELDLKFRELTEQIKKL